METVTAPESPVQAEAPQKRNHISRVDFLVVCHKAGNLREWITKDRPTLQEIADRLMNDVGVKVTMGNVPSILDACGIQRPKAEPTSGDRIAVLEKLVSLHSAQITDIAALLLAHRNTLADIAQSIKRDRNGR